MRKTRALHILETSLQMKDCPLRRADRPRLLDPREAAAEEQRRGLRHEHHTLAHLPPEQIGRGRLPTTGPSGENNAAASVLRGFHPGIVAQRNRLGQTYFGDWSTSRTITLSPDHTGGFESSQNLNWLQYAFHSLRRNAQIAAPCFFRNEPR